MLDSKKCLKYRKQLDVVLTAAFALDNLPDDPNTWSETQRQEAADAILTLGAPESFLRRFARADLLPAS